MCIAAEDRAQCLGSRQTGHVVFRRFLRFPH
jgi:hypothetical protein